MRVQILGTGAAEGFPALFCECESCRCARMAGGKNIRSRVSLRIDREFMVDLPPDTLGQSQRCHDSLADIRHLLVTHCHRDHFAPSELNWRREPFAYYAKRNPLNIYGAPPVGVSLQAAFKHDLSVANIQWQPIEPFVAFHADSAIVTPIEASHAPDSGAVNYIFSNRGHTVLLAFDTGWYGESSWEELARWRFDLVIMECSHGAKPNPGSEHLSFDEVVNMRERLLKQGCLKEAHRYLTLHFSHKSGLLHNELEDLFRNTGIEPAFDGMVVEL